MKNVIDKFLGSFLVILMAVMTLDVLWGVFTRYFLQSQASWTEELARFLLIWIGILGAAFASGQRLHLAIDLLKPKLNEQGQIRLTRFISLLILFFSISVMVIGGSRLVYITQILQQKSAALQVPMAFIYLIVPISGLLIVFYQLPVLLRPKKFIAESIQSN